MKKKLRFAAVLTAIIAVLAGTALGVAAHWDVLNAYFSGDTSPAQDLVDREVRSVSDENYAVTVESSVSDGSSAFLVVRVDALTEEARTFMASDDFNGIDTWNIHPLAPVVGENGTTTLEYFGGSTSYREVKELRTEHSATWQFDISLTRADYTHMHVRMGYMEKGLSIEFPLTPAGTIELELGTSGEGTAWYDANAAIQVTLDSVSISPLTFQMNVSWIGGDTNEGALPPVLFRMADGSLRTMPQMLQQINRYSGDLDDAYGPDASRGHGCWPIRFQSVQDLSQLSAILVWGREYPLDGGPSKAVEVDGRLLPFEIPLGPIPGVGNVGYTVPVQALCEGLGADYSWDDDTRTVTMTYRGVTVVLTLGNDTALVDGRSVALGAPVLDQDGALCVEVPLLEEAWQLWFNVPYRWEGQSYASAWTVFP